MIHADCSEGKTEIRMAGDGTLIIQELAFLVDRMVLSTEDLTVEELLMVVHIHALSIGKMRKGLGNEE